MPHYRSVSATDFPISTKLSHLIHSRACSETKSPLNLESEYHVIPKAFSSADPQGSLTTGLLSPLVSDEDGSDIIRCHKTGSSFQNSPISPSTPNSEDVFQYPDLDFELSQASLFSSCSPKSGRDGKKLSGIRVGIPDDPFPFPIQPFPVHGHRSRRAASKPEAPRFKRRYLSTGSPCSSFSGPSDRYISSRHSPQTHSETFHTSKSPHLLSGPEKLLRQQSCAPDPFGPISPRRVRERTQHLSIDRGRDRNNIRLSVTNGVSVVNVSTSLAQTQSRHGSTGSVWNIGGESATPPQGPVRAIPDGRGGWVGGGTNAPMYTANFSGRKSSIENDLFYEGRLASALDIDQNTRLLNISHSPERGRRSTSTPTETKSKFSNPKPRTKWIGGEWVREDSLSLLDAPRLRDDYYCSVLAYSHTSCTLAVGLGNRVYLWSEAYGVQFPHMEELYAPNTYVTSLSFSSTQGGHSILAIGRNDGHIGLWSLYDTGGIRFQHKQPKSVSCVAFKPVTTQRESMRFGSRVATEELLVGDDAGTVFYYSIEWMSNNQADIHGWSGAMTLMVTIDVHSQQICGLAWSQDGEYFATGANDNGCCLFDVKDVVKEFKKESNQPLVSPSDSLYQMLGSTTISPTQLVLRRNEGSGYYTQRLNNQNTSTISRISHPTHYHYPSRREVPNITRGQKQKWIHSAAIKAIAFCPWQTGLLAAGGGSNDRAIHFYHTISGACLATIDVQAQVTSLIWSTNRREIAATFGYAQPEHPYRIAVFSWPECRQVVAIPWQSDMRALLAIAYPGGPNETNQRAKEGGTWWQRTAEEGCIIVASSDESVKFHEVWSGVSKSTMGRAGLLGGSDILEALEGIEKEGVNVIR